MTAGRAVAQLLLVCIAVKSENLDSVSHSLSHSVSDEITSIASGDAKSTTASKDQGKYVCFWSWKMLVRRLGQQWWWSIWANKARVQWSGGSNTGWNAVEVDWDQVPPLQIQPFSSISSSWWQWSGLLMVITTPNGKRRSYCPTHTHTYNICYITFFWINPYTVWT